MASSTAQSYSPEIVPTPSACAPLSAEQAAAEAAGAEAAGIDEARPQGSAQPPTSVPADARDGEPSVEAAGCAVQWKVMSDVAPSKNRRLPWKTPPRRWGHTLVERG